MFGSVTKEVVKRLPNAISRARGMGNGLVNRAANKPMAPPGTMVRNHPAPKIATDGATVNTGVSSESPKKKSMFSAKRRTIQPLDDIF